MPEPVIVHTRDDIVRALTSRHTVLQSAPDAIFYAGPLYLLSMFAGAKREFAHVDAIFILDCADAGAQAVSAMQMGHTHIKSSAPAPLRAKLQDIAAQLDVVFMQD